jgi:hypothetical protein
MRLDVNDPIAASAVFFVEPVERYTVHFVVLYNLAAL